MRNGDNRCPVTGCEVLSILISSHILPWSECNEDERLDVENGILLSPDVDALFDKHLISFKDNGQLIISDIVNHQDILQLGIAIDVKINITEGMKKIFKNSQKKNTPKHLKGIINH